MTTTQIKSPQVALNSDLRSAVLATLAYSDIFDYPLTIDEIASYLIQIKTEPDAIGQALQSEAVCSDGQYYALAGRQMLLATRRRRAAYSAQLLTQAIRYGHFIGAIPFVRMVAVTGALAAGNAQPGADLDFLVVTKPGWLWLSRLMILALNRAAKLFGLHAELCPNYLITENALALTEHDLFTAQEFVRMLPVYGFGLYEGMRAQNKWVDEFLPNANGRQTTSIESEPSIFKRFMEWFMSSFHLGWIERWEMRRKIEKFSKQYSGNNETRFSADFCKGHFDGHKSATERAFQTRLDKLAIDLE